MKSEDIEIGKFYWVNPYLSTFYVKVLGKNTVDVVCQVYTDINKIPSSITTWDAKYFISEAEPIVENKEKKQTENYIPQLVIGFILGLLVGVALFH